MLILAGILITALLATEVYCVWYIKEYLRERSEQRTAARRAALRPKAYEKVRKSWAIYRNRKNLWETINK